MYLSFEVWQRSQIARVIRLKGPASADMTQSELVAMLRSKARKSGTQTSLYRGVSLLKQTGKWHAQINVGGKQVRSAS